MMWISLLIKLDNSKSILLFILTMVEVVLRYVHAQIVLCLSEKLAVCVVAPISRTVKSSRK